MSPERTGSPQDDQVATPKMSVPASPVAGTPVCEAQSPISLLLAVAQAQNNRSPDDDLTSLSWLHERDILKGMNIDPSPSNSTNSTPKQYFTLTNILPDQSPTSDYMEESSVSPGESSNSSANSSIQCQSIQYSQQKNKHPHNIPYNPMIHTSNKPPYSFSCLIFMAIEESQQKALPVKEIYAWILNHFPYFQNAPTGWKNSVRHNLSLNKCFQKVEKAPNLGKGSLWTVDPQFKPNLIQALTRSPFHPCSNLDVSSYLTNNATTKTGLTEKDTSASANRLPDPQLFPYLSKTLASVEMNDRIKTDPSDDSLDEMDAATVMLSLKNGPTMRQKRKVWQVITTSPSQDHTYSAANALICSERNEAPESDDERQKKSSTCRKIDFEDEEEERKIKGAETLLHLAGITRTRCPSGSERSHKRMRLLDHQSVREDEKPIPFKPRLLRTKRKENKIRYLNNNNNNNEWFKHRKELESCSSESLSIIDEKMERNYCLHEFVKEFNGKYQAMMLYVGFYLKLLDVYVL
ncbi:hypothetical protein WA026_006172 [Henosepilachna vigintioctopunctata]|uniref:Fork-head domain-containing protein n=1 Tax=Henosepilachna vigintioctopunctata TaxID=420089 RepID=A0AAW1TPT4_9CUCU